VDDYGGIEPEFSATSAFEILKAINELFGLVMKAKKTQPPAINSLLLGVDFEINPSMIIVQPTHRRRQKLCVFIKNALDRNVLSKSEAAKLAGKLVFLQSTLFGRLGRSALKAIYGRQYSTTPNNKFMRAIRAALSVFLQFPSTAKPRSISLTPLRSMVPLIYADAFFKLGEQTFAAGSQTIPLDWKSEVATTSPNGWGAIVFLSHEVWSNACVDVKTWPEAIVIRGETHSDIVSLFASRGAFIFILEAWAQIIPALACLHLLGDR
jgi:hypothetical protein